MGIADGFTGLFSKPVTEAEKSGTGGFFKGLAMGIGGLVAKPVAGFFGMISNASYQVASNSIDSDFSVVMPQNTRLSADGYIRLLWYQHCKRVPISTGKFDVTEEVHLDEPGVILPQNVVTSTFSVPNRLLNHLSEYFLVTVKLNFNSSAMVFSNFRIILFPLPLEFETKVPPELEAIKKERSKYPLVTISTKILTTKQSVPTEFYTEASTFSVFSRPEHGTKSIQFIEDTNGAVILSALVQRPGEADKRIDHRVCVYILIEPFHFRYFVFQKKKLTH